MRTALLLLLPLALVGFWPQLSYPEWHGTEDRRVGIAYEMVQSGDYMVPSLGEERTLNKPPLHYWVLSSVLILAGVDDLAELDQLDPRWLRLPALVSFWLLACVAYCVLLRSHSARAGWVSAAGILLSPVILHEAPSAEIDPLFACLTAASILLLAQGAALRERRWMIWAGVLGGLALLTKGPPYFMFLAGPLLVWFRHRRLWGAAYFAAPLLLPLAYYLPLLQGSVEWREIVEVAGTETIGRTSLYEWEHLLKTPGYFIKACTMVLPMGFWTFHEYRKPRDVNMQPDALLLRFCSASAVVAVVLLAFFPLRPTRYLLPAIPLFLTALGPAVAHFAARDRPLTTVQGRLLIGLGVVGAVGLMVLPFLPYPLPGRSVGFALLLGLSPMMVGRRPQLVGYAFLMPLALAWTVFPDRADYRVQAARSQRPAAVALGREVRDRGALDLQTWGHMHPIILLYSRLLPPGDGSGSLEPTAAWLVFEDRGRVEDELEAPEGYADRVRVRVHDRTFALMERVQR